MPTQPFRFAEVATAASLRPWTLTWWEFRVGEGAPKEHHVPPDGCTNLILVNQGTPFEALLAMGPLTEPRVVPAHPGMRTAGLRLHPAAAPAILGAGRCPAANQMLPVEQVAGLSAAALAEVFRIDDLESLVAEGNGVLAPRISGLTMPDALVSAVLRRIWETRGRTPLPDIAAECECSPRTMLRRVRSVTGLTPKQYARIIRFHAAVVGMVDTDARLSLLAAEGGYADQPHFHHEVTAFTGLTPAQLAERVRQTEHRLSREK
jgi:AraC-like DNA-binding protein